MIQNLLQKKNPPSQAVELDCHDLITIFNDLFAHSFNTVLVKGAGEPIYLPAEKPGEKHQVVFAHGYFASALHEISHWCIAGEERRKLVDFGYWYQPDGRTEAQQKAFEQVEVKPQALEWIFATAAGHRFHFSADNLNGDVGDNSEFIERVKRQVVDYLSQGLPLRGHLLVEGLVQFYRTPWPEAMQMLAEMESR